MTKKERILTFLKDVKEGKEITLDSPYLTPELIDVFAERELIPENPYNHFHPAEDAEFLKTMMKLKKEKGLSEKQEWKTNCILRGICQMTKRNQEALTLKKEKWLKEAEKRKAEEEAKIPTVEDLSDEQLELIYKVKQGENVLVDACIGSGKTTTIQVLCGEMPEARILYLTYNRLLKSDARKKIKCDNAVVTNYHGFASSVLAKHGVKTTPADAIQTFNRLIPEFDKERNPIGKYDLIILDEYQDVEQEIADELEYIKKRNPRAQIVAVGDMHQKIYDKTTLNVKPFIEQYLGDHSTLSFTKCFRISKQHAKVLGYCWDKEINGVNENCTIKYMNLNEILRYLPEKSPGDVLCLGVRNGNMTKVLNSLEEKYPDVYNKDTVYASIQDEDRSNLDLSGDVAIFTTYDSSKGMERKICVVFDFEEDNWKMRKEHANTDSAILRNVFCVAASRGKEEIIFVSRDKKKGLINPKTLRAAGEKSNSYRYPFNVSDMFDHKYKEEIEKCLEYLTITPKEMNDAFPIDVPTSDGLMDLSPCIGNYQSAKFFDKYYIDEVIKDRLNMQAARDRYMRYPFNPRASLLEKLLYLTYVETGQERYVKQANPHFINTLQSEAILDRLHTVFTGKEDCEVPCGTAFLANGTSVDIDGRIDAIKRGVPYELKFVDELEHKHFLQLACYLCFTNKKSGRLWNVRKNEMFEVSISEERKKEFMDQVIKTITKGNVTRYVKCPHMDLQKHKTPKEYEE